ncbi:MAG: GNAT family N-acetyltransferase, partial [Acidimicrobiales bacterium]|nr:GNAT family N-acetyltransferase [Acidimicrobiales bacterium]
LDELRSLYGRVADAGSFFVPDLLDTGHYLGRRDNRGTLVAAAGVHVVSARYGVAAIGNVATHPDHRRAGHARAVVTNLCHRLVGEVATIGLNVRAANLGARTLYRDLGFDDVADFSEAVLVRRRRGDAEP